MKCPKCGCSLPEDSAFCQYCGVALNLQTSAAALPQFESEQRADSQDVNNGSIFQQAYRAYVSDDPEQKVYLQNLLDSEELKTAYFVECERLRKEYTQGTRVNYKKSFDDFMCLLYQKYAADNLCMTSESSPIFSKPDDPTTSETAEAHNSPKRYCRRCGKPIDDATKNCTGCGKQYFKIKGKPLFVSVLLFFIVIIGYVSVNYFSAISEMNNQHFIKSKQFFDNLFVSKTLFSSKYAYVEAGILMEEGKYIEAYNAFSGLEDTPIPAALMETLTEKIYSAGQAAYQAGKINEAGKFFNKIPDYKRSDEYLFLIRCSGTEFSNWRYTIANYDRLVEMIDFENTAEIMMHNIETAERFLMGRWETGDAEALYFEMSEDETGNPHCQYNLPRKDSSGYYYLRNGIFSVGETEESSVKYYKISALSQDSISVYCYKNGKTYKLFRQ